MSASMSTAMRASMRATLPRLLELSLSHLATFAFPLVFAVVCGRTMGLHNYGIVAFYTAVAGFAGMLVEFGLDWIGLREVAQNPDRPEHCHAVLWHVTAARLVACVLVSLPLAAALAVTRAEDHASWIAAAIVYLFGFAFDIGWYLRALERTRHLLVVNAGVRVFGIGLLLWVVDTPEAIGPALWTYAALAVATSAAMWASVLAMRLVKVAPFELARVLDLYRTSWAILLGNLNGAFLTNGGLALFGTLADPALMGAASLALRVKLAGQAIVLPVLQLGYVRLASLAKAQPRAALQSARRFLAALVALSVVIAVAAALGASAISVAVFREPLPGPIGLIMLLALTIPIHSAGSMFGVQGLISFGQERAYAVVLCLASAVFCALLYAMSASPMAYGWALVGGESFVLVVCALTLRAVLIRKAVT
jgi:O-antigen/teichoic acid export membrane protein